VTYEPANKDSRFALVEGDKRRIAQVVSNLLNNAIKFTREGAITVSPRISKRIDIDSMRGEEETTELIVAVNDTGSGIDPELMPRLFTKFATQSHQGTGLGLFISKSIIEAHGGRIWAENNKDQYNNAGHNGATFYFTLPVADR
jgi:signal transduction histidine kinase